MPLRKIIEEDHKSRGKNLRRRGIPSEIFNKNFQADIVHDHASNDHDEIAKELHALAQVRALEDHIHAQIKSDGKGNNEGHEQGGDVWLQSKETKIEHLFFENVIIGKKISKQAKESIQPAASRIMIGLQWHEPPEQRIKNIQHTKDQPSYFIVYPTHEGCENSSYSSRFYAEFVKELTEVSTSCKV
jgi:hypothetical protein